MPYAIMITKALKRPLAATSGFSVVSGEYAIDPDFQDYFRELSTLSGDRLSKLGWTLGLCIYELCKTILVFQLTNLIV